LSETQVWNRCRNNSPVRIKR